MIEHKFKPGDMCITLSELHLGWELPGRYAICDSIDIDTTKPVIVLASIESDEENWCYILFNERLCWVIATILSDVFENA